MEIRGFDFLYRAAKNSADQIPSLNFIFKIEENQMKTLFGVIIISLSFSFLLFAQEETLVGNGEVTHGGFGAPVIKYTQIKGEPGLLVGGRGGWIINHTFVIGGGGYGLVNDIEANNYLFFDPWGSKPYLNFGYGGLELEYIVQSNNLIHFSIYTLIGAGGISYRNSLWDHNEDGWENWESPSDAFFVFEPEVNAELNVISFFRIDAGVSYRFISGLNFDDLKNSDLAGPSAVLTFKFGKF